MTTFALTRLTVFNGWLKTAQPVYDVKIFAHKTGELASKLGVIAQSGFLKTHFIKSIARGSRDNDARGSNLDEPLLGKRL